MRPMWVDGCRPVELQRYSDPELWRIEYRNIVHPFGLPSEVQILSCKNGP